MLCTAAELLTKKDKKGKDKEKENDKDKKD
jgi:hypothetical protein